MEQEPPSDNFLAYNMSGLSQLNNTSVLDFTISNWTACKGLSCHTGSTIEFFFNGLCIPIICVFGILGNLLNLTILAWRCSKREVEVLERGALLGLIALAVSDLCFCLGTLPNIAFYDAKTVFYEKDFHFYFQVYGVYFQNVFIKISTWLTVIIATARFVAICYPMKARILTGLFATKCAIFGTYIIWMILQSPFLWNYDVQQYTVKDNVTMYVLDLGYFKRNKTLRLSFTYLWALTGYFFPVAMLTFCNINLIRALRESRKWRECSARNAPSCREANNRITSTLVALVLMFLILVSPSELLHFYLDVTEINAYEIGILCTNLLQALNFAFHFLLYCAVNATFRRTLINIFYSTIGKIRKGHKQRKLSHTRSLSVTRGGTSMFRSVETNV